MRINFTGDSFCYKGGTDDTRQGADIAWTTLLAEKLTASVVGLGRSGSSHEHVFRTFNSSAEINVICWTEPQRLYHDHYPTSLSMAESRREMSKYYQAVYDYYKYIHNPHMAKERYKRDLYWFDHKVLANYEGLAVNLFSFSNGLYKFTHGINEFDTPLNNLRTHPFEKQPDEVANHFNVERNAELAEWLYEIIKKYL